MLIYNVKAKKNLTNPGFVRFFVLFAFIIGPNIQEIKYTNAYEQL